MMMLMGCIFTSIDVTVILIRQGHVPSFCLRLMNILLQRATTPHVQFQSGIDILVATSVTLMMMMMTYRTVLRRTPASLYHGTVLLVLVVVKSNDIIMRH